MPYTVQFTKTAAKDVKKLSPHLRNKLKKLLLEVVIPDPHCGKKLLGDLEGLYSVRLSYKDRLVYSINSTAEIIYIHRARTHYGD